MVFVEHDPAVSVESEGPRPSTTVSPHLCLEKCSKCTKGPGHRPGGSGRNGNNQTQPKGSLIERRLNTFLNIHINNSFLRPKQMR